MVIRSSDIPLLPNDLYKDRLDSYLYLYNPLSTKGVVVLNREAAYVFNLINSKRSIQNIFELIKKSNRAVKSREVLNIIRSLLDSELILLKDKQSTIKTPRQRSDLSDSKLLRVWFHITNQCNFRCVYCFVPTNAEKMEIQLALKTIKRIVVDAKKSGYHEIVCNFGGGEPLLALSELLKVIKIGKQEAKKNNILLRFGIITNGSLITPKIAAILKKENMFVAVSMDGLQKYQDLQRPLKNGQGSYKFVERGMNILRQAKVDFNAIATITSKNIEHVPALTKFSMKKDIPFIYGFYKDNPNSQENIAADPKKIIKYFKLAFNEIYKNPPKHTLLHGLLDMVVLDYPHIYPCRAGRHYLVVRHDGKIASCPISIERTIGSVNDKKLLSDIIKRGSFLKPKTRSIEDIKACKKCLWRFACCGGCPITTIQYKGSYLSNSPLCKVFKTLIPELLKVEAKRLITYESSN